MKPKFSCIIIDDDDFSKEMLEDTIIEIPELTLLRTLSEAKLAIKYLATLKPDIVFLDINMPGKTGIDIQKEIIELKLNTKIIFTTAHEEFVLEAFKNNAHDYLIKPVKKSDIYESLNRLYKLTIKQQTKKLREQENQTDKIIIKNTYTTLVLISKDIVYIQAEGSYSNIHLHNGKTEIISKNLGKIENNFQKNTFFKISRSCIINIIFLHKTDRRKKIIILKNNNNLISLKASKNKFYDFEQYINKNN